MPEISKAGAVAILLAGVMLGAGSGFATASSIDVNRGTLTTGSAAVTGVCSATPLTLTAVRSSFTAPTTYEVRRVTTTSIATACRSRPYQLTITRDASPFTSLGAWSGNTPNASSGNLDGAPGAGVNDVPTSNLVRVYAVVRTS